MTTAMPELRTERLLIRPFVHNDLDAIHTVLDHDFAAAGRSDDALSREEREAWLEWAIANHQQLATLNQPPYGDRAIVLLTTGAVIGICGLVPYIDVFGRIPALATGDPETDCLATAEVGLFWALSREHRGQGYATEAGRALIAFAFQRLRLGRLIATTDYDNHASINVMKRLGMTVDHNPDPDPPYRQVVAVLRNSGLSGLETMSEM